jgi:hypothetical protein
MQMKFITRGRATSGLLIAPPFVRADEGHRKRKEKIETVRGFAFAIVEHGSVRWEAFP